LERPKCLPLHLQRSQLISGLIIIAPSTHGAISIRLRRVVLLAQVHRLQDIPGSTIQSEVIVSFFLNLPRYSAYSCKASGSIRLPAAFNGLFGLRTSYGIASRRGIVPSCQYVSKIGSQGSNESNDMQQ